MSITLSDGTTTLTLNPDLYWADENDWSPVQQSVETTITGALDMCRSVFGSLGGRSRFSPRMRAARGCRAQRLTSCEIGPHNPLKR
jgi:hypothetical protein